MGIQINGQTDTISASDGGLSISGMDLSGVTSINASGIGTFTNGPVLIGSATSTGTASQRLQVTGGGYFSGNVGIGITNPSTKLDVFVTSGNAIRAISNPTYSPYPLSIGVIAGLSTNAASSNASQFAAAGIGVTSGEIGVYSFYPTFANFPSDRGPRRAVDLVGGFAGVWGTEYFAINVGRDGFSNDSAVLTNERLRVTGSGNLGIGTTNPSVVLDIATSNDAIIKATTTGSIQSSMVTLIGKQAGVSNEWSIVSTGNGLSGPQLRFVNGGWTSSPYMQIDSSGRVLKASQPYFYARGANSNYTLTNGADLPFNDAITNIGNHFNTTNYRFTAPIAGRYLITWSVFVNIVAGRCVIKVNGLNYNNLQMDSGAAMSQSAILSLSANDYVTVGDWQSFSGMQVYMGHCHFSGILLS